MPRTTLNLDPSVLRDLKARAEKEDKSLGTVVSEIVASALSDDRRARRPSPLRWHSAPMGPAKVDLEDKEAVRQALERR
jgi:hypothetical protein